MAHNTIRIRPITGDDLTTPGQAFAPPAGALRTLRLADLALLSHLRRHRTTVATGAALGLAAMDVSARLQDLELATGLPLVGAAAGAIALTTAGEVLGALATGEAVTAAHGSGRLRIGAPPDVPARLVDGLIAGIARCLPRWAVHRGRPDGRLGEDLDVVLAYDPVSLDAPDRWTLLVDPWILLCCSTSPLADRGAGPAAADLGLLELVTPRAAAARAELGVALCAAGITWRVAVTADQPATVHALVARGVGSAVLPLLAVDLAHAGVVAVELGHLLGARPLTLRWRAGRLTPPLVDVVRAAAVAAVVVYAAARPGGAA